MRRAITALLVTAALAGSSGAMAQRWQGSHGNNNAGGNGNQSWSGQGGGNGGQSWGGQGGGNGGQSWGGQGGGHGRWNGGGTGGSNGQGQFRVQSQNNGSGDRPHWGGQASPAFQGGSNVQTQQSWQSGGDHGRSHWNGGGFSAQQWNGNGAGWSGNDGGSARHYRQDHGGVWRDQGSNDQWRQRSGNWNNGGNWNSGDYWNGGGNWNNGGRGDWRSYRNGNRDLFHLRRYEGPRGYSYRRFYRGYTIDPFFYAQQYWIDDPWQYQLPPAYGPYRWVRYYNDALLVNIYTGEVEDVINDFFW